MAFNEVDSRIDLPKVEASVLDFWVKNQIFEKSLENRKEAPKYSFYDGPPFASGTPHYGHIVQSVSKDVIPRYWTMKGKRVKRKWGWDCHGLPIELLAEKELGITNKHQIEEIGVAKFNETCRSMVMSYVSEWEKVISRLGRWADMKNSYRTMDLSYMESVWWVFKTLYEKGLIYEGYRSMHICPRCETTLSQSEVTEGYKDIKDLSATAKFHLKSGQKFGNDDQYETKDSAYILAWTTTPWTLIGNVALAVGEEIDYTALRVDGAPELLILASERVKDVMKDREIEIVHQNIKGRDLVGLKYDPLYDYYSKLETTVNRDNGWQVYTAPFVTTEDGAGVVHIAPAFGDDDMKLGVEKQLPFVQHVGMDGVIRPEAGEFAGMQVKPVGDHTQTDVEIIKSLAHKGLLFAKEKYEHSYPHCWRCDTPLLNYATGSWFVNILKIKAEMLETAKEINWFPKHMKAGRFGKWLEGARDWSISRQRYWASVMPVWRCSAENGGCGEIKVVGSVKELEELSGQEVSDIHKDKVDPITFKCEKCQGEMKRVPDVLDTWFDSGSMPYGQLHYPFENAPEFAENFPADFIGEAHDQTRAWFYYLHVLANGLQESVAFKNVIVSGMVLAEDGKKMSKKLKNYPDPNYMLDKYGADALRLYLLTSPVLQGENLNFSEKEVGELYRGVFRMLWNSYSFFVLYAKIDKWQPLENLEPRNLLDKWIISELNILIEEVDSSVSKYNLVKSSRAFAPFIDNLSNWYIRRSRKRFWKSENDGDKNEAYQTLWTVLVELSKLMAPFTPFLADEIFKNLTGKESVHLENFPEADKTKISPEISLEMDMTRKIVEMGLSARATSGIKVRQPLRSLSYHGKRLETELEAVIAEEVNVKEVICLEGDENFVELDLQITEELKLEGYAREIIRNIQALRKKSGFDVENRIYVYYRTDDDSLVNVMTSMSELIGKEVLAETVESIQNDKDLDGEEEFAIEGKKIWFGLKKSE
jgi:isoleucyl-tRNA synthetase